MIKKTVVVSVLAVSGCVWMSGCTVGPDYERPDTAVDSAEQYHWQPQGWDRSGDANGIGPWWREFGDSATNELVKKVLKNNTDLLAATAGIQQAMALVDQAHGMRLPDLSYDATIARNKMALGPGFSFLANFYPHGLKINYIADIFGRLRRTERAALLDAFASEDERKALMHMLIAQVVETRVQIATQQRLLAIAEATIANWESALEITQNRYEGGLVSPLDVYFAKQNLSTAKVRKSQIEQQQILLGSSLAVLCGETPNGQIPSKALSDLPPLTPVPLGLPVGLLNRRPDIHAAEMRLSAATERVGVSIAKRYPDLALALTGGYQPFDASDFVSRDVQVYSAAAQLVAPLFKGGQLKAGVKAAKAAAEQAAHLYAGKILTAVKEVEDALASEQMLLKQVEQLEEGVKVSIEAQQLAKDRYTSGVEPMLAVLETERNRRLAENELAVAQGQLWRTRIQLFLALGGNWIETDGK
jgi:outer membrane protein, multidrug efflux system